MYSRYIKNGGFFEPEYEPQFTYAHERIDAERRQAAAEASAASAAASAAAEAEASIAEETGKAARGAEAAAGVETKPARDRGTRNRERSKPDASERGDRAARREERDRRLAERKRRSDERRQARGGERDRRERPDKPSRDRSALPDIGQLRDALSGFRQGGLLEGLGLDSGDILLIVLLLYLYDETQDPDMLILLGLLFLI
ncbi:MAG: hypothetical protein FWH06_05370 [Oscillospiraceae bacterium]|nr:hypothetical protein [Oscillospiraceae bacterium]